MKYLKNTLVAQVCVAVLVLCVQSAPAQENSDKADNPHLWKSKVKTVAVFKNGLGFFMREGKVTLRDGWCLSKHIPPAAFGTLAIFSHEKNHTVDIVGSGPGEIVDFDGTDAPDTEVARRSRLKAALMLNVQLTYKRDGKQHSAAGKLLSVGGDYVVLEGKSNSFAVELKQITHMQTLDLPIRVHVLSDGGRAPRSTTLGMAYLRKGITWIPDYTLRIIDDDTAELTLRGTLVNEAEDLVHCDVNFVVGVPHFVHTDYMAPIAVGQVMRSVALWEP